MSKKTITKAQKRILLISVAILTLLALMVAVVLVVFARSQTVEKGAFAPNAELESSLYRLHAKKNGVDVGKATEEEIREGAGGEIVCLMKIGVGRFPQMFAVGQAFSAMQDSAFSEGFSYYFYRMQTQKAGSQLGSKVETIVTDYYVLVDQHGNISETAMLSKEWGTFFEYGMYPWRVLPIGTDVEAVYCLDDFNNADGYYICFEGKDESYVLVRYQNQVYLATETVFRQACVDAIEAHDKKAEENGYVSGVPNPADFLSEYRVEELEVSAEGEVEKKPLSWTSICLIEVALGCLCMIPILIWKTKERMAWRRRTAIGTQSAVPVKTAPIADEVVSDGECVKQPKSDKLVEPVPTETAEESVSELEKESPPEMGKE